jgi:uncharacterized membrane protein (DUF373 family)
VDASCALKQCSPEDLLKLLKVCRTNNGAKNITGILLYANGTFLIVLIAIEIFINFTSYLTSDVIPVKLIVPTALMVISRKVIIFDYKHLDPLYVSISALVVVALGITYWLVQKHD